MQKLLLFTIVHSLWAHDLYLMPQKFRPAKGEVILLSVHTADGFPMSDQPMDPARIIAVPAISLDSWRMANKATHALVSVKDGSQYFAIFTKQRFLEMESDKFDDYLKAEGLTAQLALRKQKNETTIKSREMYAKYAKAYVIAGQSTPMFAKPLGMKAEIVPLADPASLKPGDSLPIEVLFDGKPLPDAQVELALSESGSAKSSLQIAGRTGPNGRLTVRIPSAGKIRLHSIAMDRVNQPTHDWESYWASLTFEVLNVK